MLYELGDTKDSTQRKQVLRTGLAQGMHTQRLFVGGPSLSEGHVITIQPEETVQAINMLPWGLPLKENWGQSLAPWPSFELKSSWKAGRPFKTGEHLAQRMLRGAWSAPGQRN